jgi:hypothetical protein
MRVKTTRRGNGYEARIEPIDGTYVVCGGDDATSALHSAAKLLDGALNNPTVANILPPGTIAAVKLLRGATAAIRRGNLDDFMASVSKGAGRAVARTLRKVLPW